MFAPLYSAKLQFKRLLAPALCLLFIASTTACAGLSGPSCNSPWPQWKAYKSRFIQDDGRVVEYSQGGRSTSEAQAYALFHALVANDPKTFQRVLSWTIDNLADGDLGSQLPAWHWGRNKQGNWGIIDNNSASDADMWLAYALLEAGRLWSNPDYNALAEKVLINIEALETTRIPGIGPIVLPGRRGFTLDNDRWKLNPSYFPLQILQRFAERENGHYWQQIRDSAYQLLMLSSQHGALPDWVIYQKDKGIVEETDEPLAGSYDAIRAYLWLGTLSDRDPKKHPLIQKLSFSCEIGAPPPEKINLRSGIKSGISPIGFSAALAPYFKARHAQHCLHEALRRIDKNWHKGLLARKPVYYDQNLALFGLAWLEKRYQFALDGKLLLKHCHS